MQLQYRIFRKVFDEFGKHISKDPEVWPVAVVTVGTAAYGAFLTLTKYYESVPRLPFRRSDEKKPPHP